MYTNFSQRLSKLMKERKISGQKIADAVGKSQKTISRYANGEIEPRDEIKNLIFKTIAEISGIEEDGLTVEELWHQMLMDEIEDYDSQGRYPEAEEDEIWGMEEELFLDPRICNLRDDFNLLSIDARSYYLNHMDEFHNIEKWEMKAIQFYKELPVKKQKIFVENLERYDFKYVEKREVNHKIATYIALSDSSEFRPSIYKLEQCGKRDTLVESRLKNSWIERMHLRRCNNIVDNIDTLEFVYYTSYDWYILSRLQIMKLYDFGECEWKDINGNVIAVVGYKFLQLIEEMKVC